MPDVAVSLIVNDAPPPTPQEEFLVVVNQARGYVTPEELSISLYSSSLAHFTSILLASGKDIWQVTQARDRE